MPMAKYPKKKNFTLTRFRTVFKTLETLFISFMQWHVHKTAGKTLRSRRNLQIVNCLTQPVSFLKKNNHDGDQVYSIVVASFHLYYTRNNPAELRGTTFAVIIRCRASLVWCPRSSLKKSVASSPSFPPFGRAQDKLQRESRSLRFSWIPGRASYRQLARNDD